MTALVSVQMLESSRATVTDAVVKDALKTLAVRQQIPEAERLAVLPYKIGELSGFRVVITAHDGMAVLTQGPKDAVENVEQPFVLMSVVTGEAPKPDDRDKIARPAFSSAPGIKDIRITRSEPLRMGQSNGHEIVAEAKDAKSGIDVTTVQWLRFGERAICRCSRSRGARRGTTCLSACARSATASSCGARSRKSFTARPRRVLSFAGPRPAAPSAALRDADQRRTQHALADRVARLHHLHDGAGRDGGIGHLEHRLMQVRVELLPRRARAARRASPSR